MAEFVPDSSNAPQERLLDLLERWQSLQQQGRSATAIEVCVDWPELAGELERLAQFTRQVETLAGDATAQSTPAPGWTPTLDLPAAPIAPLLPVLVPEERYAFKGKLGEGGMGAVYRVHDRSLGRTVALKVIKPDAMSPQMRVRFETEARAVARLDHPHIVKVFDVGQMRPPGEPDAVPFLTLEFVEGGSLTKRLDGRPLAPSVVIRLVALLARAMQHAHERGIVHRDLKPDNVLLAPPSTMASLNTPVGCPKITDFGLAKPLQASPLASPGRKSGEILTRPGSIMGTPSYMAPEQAEGLSDIGPPADVWALGIILYRLLTGALPFAAPSIVDLLHQICREEPTPLEQFQPGIPVELAEIVHDCLRKSPAERPTAADLAERLERFARTTGVETASFSTVPERRPRRRPGSRRLRVGILAALIVAAIAVLTWRLWPEAKDEDTRTQRPDIKPPALTIHPLQVMHYETVGTKAVPRGRTGEQSFATRWGDAVTLTVELSAPAYFYVIAFNFDGKEHLEWPVDEEGMGSDQVAPPKVERLRLPSGGKQFFLDEPGNGLQAYIVAASSKPLPPYAEWRAERRGVSWKALPPGKTVWQADTTAAYAVVPGFGANRSSIKEPLGVPPLTGLCRALQTGGVEKVEAIAFPVLPKERE